MNRLPIAPLVLALTGTVVALAQAPSGKVGVINIQSAISTTKDGQKAAGELEAKATPKRKALEAKQNELNALKDQLQKGSNALSETAKQELVRSIDAKTKYFERDMQDAQAESEQDTQKALQELGQKMVAVIDKYARDNGFVLIMDVSSPQTPVLFASPTIDVTKDIITLYDKANPGTTTSSAAPATSAPATTPRPPAATPAAPRPSTTPAATTPAKPKPPGTN